MLMQSLYLNCKTSIGAFSKTAIGSFFKVKPPLGHKVKETAIGAFFRNK
jgi:hypothetical protein